MSQNIDEKRPRLSVWIEGLPTILDAAILDIIVSYCDSHTARQVYVAHSGLFTPIVFAAAVAIAVHLGSR